MPQHMIQFRCWYCNRRYLKEERRIGERFTCFCKRLVRVPKNNNGNCRVLTWGDWLAETVVYAFGSALLAFLLGLIILSQWYPAVPRYRKWYLVAALTLAGFLAGLFGGERTLNWLGRKIRDWENDR